MQLLRGLPEPLAEAGVGDGDERPCALGDAAAVELGDALLGDDRLDVATGRDDAGAGWSVAVIREIRPSAAVAGSAMIARPSSASAAPRTKFIWPPTPL